VTSAEFLAKVELKLAENNDELNEISGMLRHWQENAVGLSQKNEARVFTLQSILQEMERARESEFGLIKELIKKLLFALESKAHYEESGDQIIAKN